MLITVLQSLDQTLKNLNPSLYKILDDPLTDKELDEVSSRLNFPLSEDVRTLYKWKNGTKTFDMEKIGLGWISGLSRFNSISELEILYGQYEVINRKINNNALKNNLICLFKSDGGELTFIDIDPNSPTFNQLFFLTYYEPELELISSYASSLSSFLNAVIECYEKKIFFFDYENGTFGYSPLLSIPVFYHHNPNSEYWKFYYENMYGQFLTEPISKN